MSDGAQYGGIEAGGTKFICAIGRGPGEILSEARIETTLPDETLQRVVRFFRPAANTGTISSIGIGCFGPLDLDPQSSKYGFITATTKAGWSNTDVVGQLQRELGIRVTMDTDVNAAALGESTWGAGRDVDPILYLTIGTGIGGGFVNDGRPITGLLHPEMGHIRIPHDPVQDPFPGVCPFHGDCFEGLASGPAVSKRMNLPADQLGDDDPYWQLEVNYIALAVQNLVVTLSPRKVILGGGIMQRAFLLPLIRARVKSLLNGYVQHSMVLEKINEYIVPPLLGKQSGVLGAIALARLLD